jgi:hypothetical protein
MQSLFCAVRPKLFPSKGFYFHTTCASRLRRYSDDDKDNFQIPNQTPGRPDRQRGPTTFSFFSMITRSAREARERRRDKLPAKVNHFYKTITAKTNQFTHQCTVCDTIPKWVSWLTLTRCKRCNLLYINQFEQAKPISEIY